MQTRNREDTMMEWFKVLVHNELTKNVETAVWPLSSLELQIFQLTANGYSVQEVAQALGLTPDSVRTYRAKALHSITNPGVKATSSAPQAPRFVRVRPGKKLERPPINAEYLLYLFLSRDEREIVIGDLVEVYGEMVRRFNKPRADFWFYKQVLGSLWPLFRRAVGRIGALVWLGHVLRRLIS